MAKHPPLLHVPWKFYTAQTKFLDIVTEGVVHGVYKVVTQLSFGERQGQVSGGKCIFVIVSQCHIQTSDGN